MKAKDGTALLKKAKEKTEIDGLYQFYCANYAHMKKKKPFSEFLADLKKSKPRVIRKKMTKEEIIALAENIRIKRLTNKGKSKK
jgi:hypothetical protein